MSKCPACERNTSATNTTVGDFHILCEKHKQELEDYVVKTLEKDSQPTHQQQQDYNSK